MKATRLQWILCLLVVAGLVVVFYTVPSLAALSGNSTPESRTRLQTQTPEPDGKPQSIDDLFAEVARRVPAFGGMFIGRDQTLQVYLLDASQRAAAEEAIVAVFGRERLPQGGIQALPGRYGFLQLKTWHDLQRMKTLAIPGVVMTSIAESKNQLQIGVKDASVIPYVENELFKLEIPREAVNIVETPPVEPLQTLQSTERPFMGGLQIQRNSGGGCTMSFPAVRQGVAGFVTNSHCTNTQGGVEGTIFHQATINGVINRVGVETVDPAYSGGGDCPSGRVCRFSDSAFVARNAGQNAATLAPSAYFGYLALPDSSLGIVNKFHIIGEVPLPIEGESLSKVGRTTGMTSGEVCDTCVDVNQSGSNITLFCQDRVSANSMPGDSGSPVFSWSSATLPPGATIPAKLRGILWGGSGGTFVFSALAFIEAELGQLKTANGQAGANSLPEVRITAPASSSITVGSGGLNIVNFKASVEDYEGCCTEVKWESSLDGLIGVGTNIDHTFSGPGTRVVTITAKDNAGALSMDSVTVIVSNGAPTVAIVKPTSGQTLYTGSPFIFQGDSWDANEPFQTLPCNSLKWTSSNLSDPFPKWGCTPSVTFSTTGSRTITLKGTDSDGASDTATVTINVANAPVGGPPVVTILNPHNDGYLDGYTFASLKGTANDPDNENPLTYTWKVKDGSTWKTLFTGTMNDQATVTKSWKPSNDLYFNCGGREVRIYLYVTDPDGKTGSAYIDVFVAFPVC